MKIKPTSATSSLKNDLICEESMVDIRKVMESDLMCEELIIDVPLVMETGHWPECCIYRVPKNLRQINKEAYSPKLISIGPFHHSKEEVRDMEKLKVRYLKEFCYRTGICQREIARVIEENEVTIRPYYEEIFDISSEDFVKMVLLDSTFIIELFLRAYDMEKHKDDFILSNPMLEKNLQLDLILLENQLPFFILDKLYKKFYQRHGEKPIFKLIAYNYFRPFIKKEPKGETMEIKHFTDLIRLSYCPSIHQLKEREKIPCAATKLYETGVMIFGSDKDLLDISFSRLTINWLPSLTRFGCFERTEPFCTPTLTCFGCLERTQPLLKIPRFIINDATEGLLGNIILLEQCHYPLDAFVCNYMVILGYLIKTREDVELLIEKNVIVNNLGSNEVVAEMVNRLCIGIVENNSYYAALAETLYDHHVQHSNQSMGYLRRTYFSNLWRTTVTIVGLIVFGFTFWSTIRPYVAPKIDSVHCV